MSNHLLTDTPSIRAYVFGCASRAIFTLQSAQTGTRFTYRIRRNSPSRKPFFFADTLTGPDNESNYLFSGTISRDSENLQWKFHWSYKSNLDARVSSVLALDWFIERLNYDAPLQPTKVSFYYSGRCSRCGRLLTTPESLERGLGPKCAEKAAALI